MSNEEKMLLNVLKPECRLNISGSNMSYINHEYTKSLSIECKDNIERSK